MSEDRTALMQREYQTVLRLVRLFRMERTGRLARWPEATAAALTERRGWLIDELHRLEELRRAREPEAVAELELAMGVLARELRYSEQHCLARLAELGVELERRREVGATTTGLRHSGVGRVLGYG